MGRSTSAVDERQTRLKLSPSQQAQVRSGACEGLPQLPQHPELPHYPHRQDTRESCPGTHSPCPRSLAQVQHSFFIISSIIPFLSNSSKCTIKPAQRRNPSSSPQCLSAPASPSAGPRKLDVQFLHPLRPPSSAQQHHWTYEECAEAYVESVSKPIHNCCSRPESLVLPFRLPLQADLVQLDHFEQPCTRSYLPH